jgi:hypothetical protein
LAIRRLLDLFRQVILLQRRLGLLVLPWAMRFFFDLIVVQERLKIAFTRAASRSATKGPAGQAPRPETSAARIFVNTKMLADVNDSQPSILLYGLPFSYSIRQQRTR